MRVHYKLAGLLLTALLGACGGGGGGGSTAPVAPPVETVFQFKAAFVNSVSKSFSLPFTVSGTASGLSVTGSGTITKGTPTAATFENIAAQRVVSTSTGTITVGGQNAPLSTVSASFYDSNYLPIGNSSSTEYLVVTGTAVIPATGKINDTGELYTTKEYTNSTKAVLIGTVTVSFALQPDTATTALVKVISVYKNTSGAVTLTGTTTLRTTVDGTITYVSSSSLYANGNTVTFTF